ncbi:MAG: DNA internalization-related competence protein ComEC/Rec2 [Dehalococcoidia bacterium]
MTLAYLAAAWLFGTVTAALGWDAMRTADAGIAVCSAAIVANLVQRRPRVALLALACGGLFAGAFFRFEASGTPTTAGGIAAFNDGSAVTFQAVAADDSEEHGRAISTRLRATLLQPDGGDRQQINGGVLLWEPSTAPRHRYGDALEITGKLTSPSPLPNFDYPQYLAQQGISSIADYPKVTATGSNQGNAILLGAHRLRRGLSAALAEALPQPQAALAQGILLGERSALPQDLKDDLNATSTSHIIALSGYNVTLVAGFCIGAFAWLIGRRRAALLALFAIGGYVLLTGVSPSLLRAAIMGGLYIFATVLGRPNSGPTPLLLAGAVMAGLQPSVVTDISFQLSFAATAGLIVLVPLLRERAVGASQRFGGLQAHLEQGPLSALFEIAVVTAAASLASLPLIALHFQRVSLVALPANMVVLPSVPFIMLSSMPVALAGLVCQPLAHFLGYFAWAGLTYMTTGVRFFAALPFASLQLARFNAEQCAAMYVVLAAFAWTLSRRRPGSEALQRIQRPLRRVLALPARPLRAIPTVWLAGALALPAVLTWTAVFLAPNGRLTVEMFNVGQGDSILIRTPDGQKLLIDGGPDGATVERALDETLPFWDRKLDVVLSTHTDSDHLTGLITVAQRYSIGQVIEAPIQTDDALIDEWDGVLDQKAIPHQEVEAGGWIDLGRDIRLQVLGPPQPLLSGTDADTNNNSLVLKLTWGSVSFLLPGDIQTPGEMALLAEHADLRATVLKVPHHGSAYSSGQEFVNAVQPVVSVISVGANNSYGDPADQTLQRLDKSIVYRTDEQGDITFSTDGERLWITPERDPPPLPSRFSAAN